MPSNPSNPGPYTAFYRDIMRCRFAISARSNDAIVDAVRDHKLTCLVCQRADTPILFSLVSKDPEPIPYEYRHNRQNGE